MLKFLWSKNNKAQKKSNSDNTAFAIKEMQKTVRTFHASLGAKLQMFKGQEVLTPIKMRSSETVSGGKNPPCYCAGVMGST